jgi:hypothetical protein
LYFKIFPIDIIKTFEFLREKVTPLLLKKKGI